MSMNMSLRFEVAGRGGSLVKSLNREKDRILNDEEMAERILTVKKETDINLKAEWAESLEEVSRVKRYRQNKKDMASELSFASKAVIAVRRAALRELLEKDHAMYEEELGKIGKAFYVKRI